MSKELLRIYKRPILQLLRDLADLAQPCGAVDMRRVVSLLDQERGTKAVPRLQRDAPVGVAAGQEVSRRLSPVLGDAAWWLLAAPEADQRLVWRVIATTRCASSLTAGYAQHNTARLACLCQHVASTAFATSTTLGCSPRVLGWRRVPAKQVSGSNPAVCRIAGSSQCCSLCWKGEFPRGNAAAG